MHILVDTCSLCPWSGRKTDREVLCWILENYFDLDNMCGVSDLFTSFAEKDIGPVKEQKSVTASITFHCLPFFGCSVCNKPKVKFMHSSSQIEHKKTQ